MADPAPLWPMRVMSCMWAAMAIPCMLAPEFVMGLSINDDARAPVATPDATGESSSGDENKVAKRDPRTFERILMGCFGAQAMMVALLLGTSRLDRRGYTLFGAAILPFFVFDAFAIKGGYCTAFGGIGDAVGNTVFLSMSACGALMGNRNGRSAWETIWESFK